VLPEPNSIHGAERLVRTVRAELLDLVLVIGRRQFLSVLKEYEHPLQLAPTPPRHRPPRAG
jgi:hypothetical protein